MRRGFTLVELIATVAIMTVLAGVIVPFWGSAKTYSDRQLAVSKAASVDRAKVQYLADNGANAYTVWDTLATDNAKYDVLKQYLGTLPTSWTTFSTTDPKNYTYTIGGINDKTLFAIH